MPLGHRKRTRTPQADHRIRAKTFLQ